MKLQSKIISIFELRRFRKKIVFKVLKCSESCEVENILDSLNYSDRKWVIEHVRIYSLIKEQNEMKKEIKDYNRSIPRWKRKQIMYEFEKRLHSKW